MNTHNPYAPPGAPYGGPPVLHAQIARIEGTCIVLRNGAALPPVCVKCGRQHAVEWRRQKFAWSPPWTIAVIFFSLCIGGILAVVLQKRSEFQLPICPDCNANWKRWNVFLALAGLSLIGLIPVAMVMSSVTSSDVVSALIGFAAFAGIAAFVTVAVFRGRAQLTVKKIDPFETWVHGMHPETARMLTGWGTVAAPFGAGGYYGH